MRDSASIGSGMDTSGPEWLAKPVKEVAAMFGVSERHLWGFVMSGEIESFKIGRVRLIPRSGAIAFRDRLVREAKAELERVAALSTS
jgi:hypothetical protein